MDVVLKKPDWLEETGSQPPPSKALHRHTSLPRDQNHGPDVGPTVAKTPGLDAVRPAGPKHIFLL